MRVVVRVVVRRGFRESAVFFNFFWGGKIFYIYTWPYSDSSREHV